MNPPFAFPHPSGAQGAEGMSLRDYFAGQVAPVCFALDHGNGLGWVGTQHAPLSAQLAYRWADALLAARESGQ